MSAQHTPSLAKTASQLADALIAAPSTRKPAAQYVVGMKSGETYEQALARVARIKAMVAKATGSEQ